MRIFGWTGREGGGGKGVGKKHYLVWNEYFFEQKYLLGSVGFSTELKWYNGYLWCVREP